MILIEVCIGMVFLFLTLSLIATAIQELIASWRELRGKKLLIAIKNAFENNPSDDLKQGDVIYNAFIKHPLYKQLCTPKGEKKDKKKPSYIGSSTFSDILISVLSSDDQSSLPQISCHKIKEYVKTKPLDDDFKKTILYYLEISKDDIEVLKKNLEGWFDNIMDRATGWYKRDTQWSLFIIGLVLAAGLNVNAIQAFQHLLTNDTEREIIVQQASDFVINNPEIINDITKFNKDTIMSTDEKADSIQVKLDSLMKTEVKPLLSNLGLGWSSKATQLPPRKEEWLPKYIYINFYPLIYFIFSMLLGWLISAFAVSLGAPFWFDSLTSLVNIRGAGKTPNKSGTPQEQQK